MREAYRLNKSAFYQFLQNKELRIQLLIVYVAPEVMSYHDIEAKFKMALDHIMASVEKRFK